MAFVLTKNNRNKPEFVILHCSASPDYCEKDEAFDSIGASQINEWHLKRGWDGIGYHNVIKRSGIIQPGRPYEIQGAHVEGHNKDSLGVCWVGTYRPTEAQIISICNLYVLLFREFKITWENWFGHYEFNNKKECPGFSMDLMRKLLQYHHYHLMKEKRPDGAKLAKNF